MSAFDDKTEEKVVRGRLDRVIDSMEDLLQDVLGSSGTSYMHEERVESLREMITLLKSLIENHIQVNIRTSDTPEEDLLLVEECMKDRVWRDLKAGIKSSDDPITETSAFGLSYIIGLVK